MCAPSDWWSFKVSVDFARLWRHRPMRKKPNDGSEAQRQIYVRLLLIYLHLLLSLTVCPLSDLKWVRIFDMFSWRQHWAMQCEAGQVRERKGKNLLISIRSAHIYLLKLDTLISSLINDIHHPGIVSGWINKKPQWKPGLRRSLDFCESKWR